MGVAFDRSDDPILALEFASNLFTNGRYDLLASTNGDAAGPNSAAVRVTEVADVFVAWLRKLATVEMTVVAIEEIDGSAVYPPPEGNEMTNIDTSQRVRYVLTGRDDRGFEVDGDLAGRVGTEGVVTLEVTQATAGTASGKDEAVATFAGLGTTTVEIFDSANPTVVLAVDTIVANPGGIAAVEMAATVEEIPAP